MNRHPQAALAAYETLAPDYDTFTAHHDYEGWVGGMLELLAGHGLRGRCALDAGCGTGKSFMPLLERGFEVTACDASAAMAAQARAKAAGRADVLVEDLRDLPRIGSFDLVTCLDDVVNYLTSPPELLAALRGLAANLKPSGLLIFDANTLHTYRTFFAETQVVEATDALLLWQGRESDAFAKGELATATLDVFAQEDAGWSRRTSVHFQRHHPEPLLRRLLEAAGLSCLGIYGQFADVTFEQRLRETTHIKAVCIARCGPDLRSEKGGERC